MLLLDREQSKWSLFQRLNALVEGRPGYQSAMENLLIDHDHRLRLDQANAYDTLLQLVEQNGAEVVILDTAYKFLGGDVESSSSLMKAFKVLDRVLHETGCSIVLTHHLKKGQGGKAKENTDVADPDAVAGSFLWTGWPNATVLVCHLSAYTIAHALADARSRNTWVPNVPGGGRGSHSACAQLLPPGSACYDVPGLMFTP